MQIRGGAVSCRWRDRVQTGKDPGKGIDDVMGYLVPFQTAAGDCRRHEARIREGQGWLECQRKTPDHRRRGRPDHQIAETGQGAGTDV